MIRQGSPDVPSAQPPPPWLAALARDARPFERARRDAAAAQRACLRRALAAGQGTAFGREHGFDATADARAYARAVPVRTWEDVAPYVDRIRAGERSVLTSEPVDRLEPTSGSTSGTKWIPSTPNFRRDVRKAVAAWLASLYAERPKLRAGCSYWALSPSTPPPMTPGASAVPVGFARDADYLGPTVARLFRDHLAVPDSVAGLDGAEVVARTSLLHLLARADLRLISVWSPTFFEALLRRAAPHLDAIFRDLAGGRGVPAQPGRARRLARLWSAGAPDAWPLAAAWPRVEVVSCWADAWAAEPARRLAARFPSAVVQPKGLMSTEGVVSIPLGAGEACRHVLAATSHYVEGLDPETGETWPMVEAPHGRRLEVVLTTRAGLYRVRTGDLVELRGHVDAIPVVAFLGRAREVSDLVGEKLQAGAVEPVLDRVLGRPGPWRTIVPDASTTPPRYLVLAEAEPREEDDEAAEADLERGLRGNYHYAHARNLGQLGPVRLLRHPGMASLVRDIRSRWAQQGVVKEPVFDPRPRPWSHLLREAGVRPDGEQRGSAT